MDLRDLERLPTTNLPNHNSGLHSSGFCIKDPDIGPRRNLAAEGDVILGYNSVHASKSKKGEGAEGKKGAEPLSTA